MMTIENRISKILSADFKGFEVGLSLTAKMILIALVMFEHNHKKPFTVSSVMISRMIGIKRPSVSRSLKRLAACNFIQISRRNCVSDQRFGTRTNLYTINWSMISSIESIACDPEPIAGEQLVRR